MPAACPMPNLDAESCKLPTAAAASPVMVAIALLGLPSAAPVAPAFDKDMVNDLLPENGVALLMGIEKVFDAASPLAQLRVPLVAVKFVPATALPAVVSYVTLAAPLEPPVRVTVTVNEPAPWATV